MADVGGLAPRELFDLGGRVALVTGAGGGIGSWLAAGLLAAGAEVKLTDCDPDRLQRVARHLGADTRVADLTDDDAARDLAEWAGGIDVLVNCAGINRRKPIDAVAAEDFDTIMAVNLRAPYFLSLLVARRMEARGGAIVHVGSVNSAQGVADVSVYGASKAALTQLTRVQSIEWAPRGIRVNCLAPGFMRTPLSEPLWADARRSEWILSRVPQQRPGLPAELRDDPIDLPLEVVVPYLFGVLASFMAYVYGRLELGIDQQEQLLHQPSPGIEVFHTSEEFLRKLIEITVGAERVSTLNLSPARGEHPNLDVYFRQLHASMRSRRTSLRSFRSIASVDTPGKAAFLVARTSELKDTGRVSLSVFDQARAGPLPHPLSVHITVKDGRSSVFLYPPVDMTGSMDSVLIRNEAVARVLQDYFNLLWSRSVLVNEGRRVYRAGLEHLAAIEPALRGDPVFQALEGISRWPSSAPCRNSTRDCGSPNPSSGPWSRSTAPSPRRRWPSRASNGCSWTRSTRRC
ncbi:SDR family NAD(P)-dependent oxidoreductase [Streptomycetaceae bacterium NBC_01309]